MRIVVANWNDRVVGGAEAYLAAFLPLLVEDGVELAFWSESSTPDDRPSVIPPGCPHWCADRIGVEQSFHELDAWAPDLIFSQGFTDPDLERRLLDSAPAIFFAHNYYGTCITGGKTNHNPVVQPCHRTFGPACLGHFYPRRCGGLSPVTMIRNYRVQSQRNRIMPDYLAVFCASTHMQAELVRHGVDARRVHLNPYPVPQPAATVEAHEPPTADKPWTILFAARMEAEKGAAVLLDAADQATRLGSTSIHLVLAGDGRERSTLERRAADLTAENRALTVEFPGWLERDEMSRRMTAAHLLAFPSLWPEPFGIVGVEAGHFGLPAVAFDAGGVGEWLEDGVNGTMAPSDPPTAKGYADALLRAMDPTLYPRMSVQAISLARRFSLASHRHGFWETLAEAGYSRPGSAPSEA